MEFERLHGACASGDLDQIEELLQTSGEWPRELLDERQGGLPPLHVAVLAGHLRVVRKLCEEWDAHPSEWDDFDFTPLQLAKALGLKEIADYLTAANAYAGEPACPTFYQAVEAGHLPLAARLLARGGADVNEAGDRDVRPLHLAAERGDLRLVELLIGDGARLQDEAVFGPPLTFAAYGGSRVVAEFLISKGAAITCPNDQAGSSPLHVASYQGHGDVVEFLLSHAADPENTTWAGETALALAVRHRRAGVVKILLEHGADPNCRCLSFVVPEQGVPVVAAAATEGSWEIVGLLLQHGADAKARAVRGETLIELATRAGREDIVQLLVEKQA